AGALEIVSSGTRRNTRDVGVTFPTPRSSQQLQEPPGLCQGGAAGAWHQPWARQGPGRHGPGRSRLHFQPGTPWLAQAEDLSREWRKENQPRGSAGPGPAWFEPWAISRAWREPLRERNWGEQPSRGQGAA
ncbi:ALMS1 protein, partial [Leucopsar rothschildi]|nr:ALMS1 protein [Leucopsar rothschildi]